MAERKALGKGLGALIPDTEGVFKGDEGNLYCNIDDIQPNPYQPRTVFDKEKIEELAHSIRAAKIAGHKRVPIIVKKASDLEQLEYSLIENLQREDLNPIEEAAAYKRLMKEFGYTQQKLSQALGKNRTTIANQLRLLNLPGVVKESLARNEITMGHARSLLSLSELQKQREAYRILVHKGLSVRETER
ncbi:MAG: ParB/RepB/Spo0J family partition protein, partial [Deltaproteobacteria bacterium]|nr:ParB/RepB/Spo0J family partition protein [Deltaproteobacteria bacterium]